MVEIGAVESHDHSEDGTEVIVPKVLHGQVYGDHADFDTAQEAIDWAYNEGFRTVVFPPKNYGPIEIPGNGDSMIIKGTTHPGSEGGYVALFDGSNDNQPGISEKSGGGKHMLHNLRAVGANTWDIDFSQSNRTHVVACQGDTFVDGLDCRIQRCYCINLELGGNSSRCVVDDSYISTLTNNGSGNVIGETVP